MPFRFTYKIQITSLRHRDDQQESVSISVCSKNFNSVRVSNYYEPKSNLASYPNLSQVRFCLIIIRNLHRPKIFTTDGNGYTFQMRKLVENNGFIAPVTCIHYYLQLKDNKRQWYQKVIQETYLESDPYSTPLEIRKWLQRPTTISSSFSLKVYLDILNLICFFYLKHILKWQNLALPFCWLEGMTIYIWHHLLLHNI